MNHSPEPIRTASGSCTEGRPFPIHANGGNAFTLIEMLVAMTVAAILCTLTFVGYKVAVGKRDVAVCISNLRMMHMDILNYARENDDRLPPIENTSGDKTNYWMDSVSLSVYGDNQKRPHQGCPAERRYLKFRPTDRTYSINATLIRHVNPKLFTVPDPSRSMLIADGTIPNGKYNYYLFAGSYLPYPIHNGKANILFFDGHIEARELSEIPPSPGIRGSDAWVFWYGLIN